MFTSTIVVWNYFRVGKPYHSAIHLTHWLANLTTAIKLLILQLNTLVYHGISYVVAISILSDALYMVLEHIR